MIVCEGAKTEPNYFQALKRNLRSGTLAIEIYGEECGSDPISVVKFAKKLQGEAKRRMKRTLEPAYDEIWCVIDVDQHPNLNRAISDAAQSGMSVALSHPCFEYWLLLHFVDTNRGFRECSEVIRELRGHISDYTKGRANLNEFLARTEIGLANAEKYERLRPAGQSVVQLNSSSDVHKLVKLIHDNSVKPYAPPAS